MRTKARRRLLPLALAALAAAGCERCQHVTMLPAPPQPPGVVSRPAAPAHPPTTQGLEAALDAVATALTADDLPLAWSLLDGFALPDPAPWLAAHLGDRGALAAWVRQHQRAAIDALADRALDRTSARRVEPLAALRARDGAPLRATAAAWPDAVPAWVVIDTSAGLQRQPGVFVHAGGAFRLLGDVPPELLHTGPGPAPVDTTLRPRRLGPSDPSAGDEALVDLAATPDGRTFLSVSYDARVTALDARDGSTRMLLAPSPAQPVSDLAVAPDGRLALALSWHIEVRRPDGGLLLRYHLPFGPARPALARIAWSPDGAWLAAGTQDGLIRVLDGTTLLERMVWRTLRPDPVNALAWGPDHTLAVSNGTGGVTLFRAAHGERIWTTFDPGGPDRRGDTSTLVFTPGGDLLVGGYSGTIYRYDARGTRLSERLGETYTLYDLLPEDEHHILVASSDGVHRWDLDRDERLAFGLSTVETTRLVAGEGGTVAALTTDAGVVVRDAEGTVLRERQDLAVQYSPGCIRGTTLYMVDEAEGDLVSVPLDRTAQPTRIDAAPTGIAQVLCAGPTTLLLQYELGDARIFDLTAGQTRSRIPDAGGYGVTYAFSDDGRTLVITSDEERLRVVRVGEEGLDVVRTVRDVSLSPAALLPDGRAILAVSYDDAGDDVLWSLDLTAPRAQPVMTRLPESFSSLVPSPDGARFALQSASALEVRRVADPAQRLWQTRRETSSEAIAWLPGGRQLLSDVDGTLEVIDADSGLAQRVIPGSDPAARIVVGPDHVAVFRTSGSVELWRAAALLPATAAPGAP